MDLRIRHRAACLLRRLAASIDDKAAATAAETPSNPVAATTGTVTLRVSRTVDSLALLRDGVMGMEMEIMARDLGVAAMMNDLIGLKRAEGKISGKTILTASLEMVPPRKGDQLV